MGSPKHSFFLSLSYRFSPGEGRRGRSPRRSPKPHGFQQPLIVLLAPHQDGTKQGRRCSHVTWSLVNLWAGSLGVASRTCLANLSWDILVMWPKHPCCDLSIRRRGGSKFRAVRISLLRTFLQKSQLCSWYLRYQSFSHFPTIMTIGEDRNKDRFKN